MTSGIYHGREEDTKISSFGSLEELMEAMRTRVMEDIMRAIMSKERRDRFLELMTDNNLLGICAEEARNEEQGAFNYQKLVHGEDYFKKYTCHDYFKDEEDGILTDEEKSRWEKLKHLFIKDGEKIDTVYADGDEQLGFELWKLDNGFANDTLSYAARVWTNAMKWRA